MARNDLLENAEPFAVHEAVVLIDEEELPISCDSDLRQVARVELLNRSRDAVALDLKSAAGLAAMRRLLAGADAFIEGFRPGMYMFASQAAGAWSERRGENVLDGTTAPWYGVYGSRQLARISRPARRAVCSPRRRATNGAR